MGLPNIVSEKGHDEKRNSKVAYEDPPPTRTPHTPWVCPWLWGPVVFKQWRSWVTPVSRLISQIKLSCWVGWRVLTLSTVQHNPLVFVSCHKQEKKHWKGGEIGKFVCEGVKLISKVKGKECMPLKQEKESLCFKALFEQHTAYLSHSLAKQLCHFGHIKKTDLFEKLQCTVATTLVPTCLYGHTCKHWREFAPLWRKIALHCLFVGEQNPAVCKIRQNKNLLYNVKSI